MVDISDIERDIAVHHNKITELSHAAGARIAAARGITVGTRVTWRHGKTMVEGDVVSWSWAGANINIVVARVLADGSLSDNRTPLHWRHNPQVVK